MQKVKIDILNYAPGYSISELNDQDKIDGVCLEFGTDSASMLGKLNYKNNELNGTNTRYYPEGTIREIINYKDGKRDGKYESFYENGSKKEISFYKDGKCEGEVRTFFKNGKTMSIFFYKNDQVQGVGKEFFENGSVKSCCEYSDGKRNGVYEDYFENGKLHCKATFKNDQQDGETVFFYQSGNIKSKSVLENGVNVQDTIIYYDSKDPIVKCVFSFKDGKSISKKVFFDNGQEITIGDSYNTKVIIANYAFLTKKYDIEIVKDKEKKYVRNPKIGTGKGRYKRKRK